MATQAVVHVVDDDEAVREALSRLLASVHLTARLWPSAEAFLDQVDDVEFGCLLLDVRMPGMSGLALQAQLTARAIDLPIIILTGHADVPMAVRAMKAGAMEFFEKPFSPQALLDAVQRALRADARRRQQGQRHARTRARLASLTSREREVLDLIVAGRLNKEIGLDLRISERTVEDHRSRVMRKMNAGSVAQLVRMVVELTAHEASGRGDAVETGGEKGRHRGPEDVR